MPISINNPSLQRYLQKITPPENMLRTTASDRAGLSYSENDDESDLIVFTQHLFAPVTVRQVAVPAKKIQIENGKVSFKEIVESNPCKLLHLNHHFRV